MEIKPAKLDNLKRKLFIHHDSELAELSQIAPETLSRLRHGRNPKLETLERICSGFNKRLKALKKQRIAPKKLKKVKLSDFTA